MTDKDRPPSEDIYNKKNIYISLKKKRKELLNFILSKFKGFGAAIQFYDCLIFLPKLN